MFLMWLGEQITERGIGNGISLIICAGIAAGYRRSARPCRWRIRGCVVGLCSCWRCLSVMLVTALVVFFERGQRKILVNYAKRQVGNRVMRGPARICR